MIGDDGTQLGILPPFEAPLNRHVYHLYVIRTARRAGMQAYLAERGISTLIHYPVPVHLQTAYLHLGYAAGSFPVTEQVASEILSLPLYPHLGREEVDLVLKAVKECPFFDREPDSVIS